MTTAHEILIAVIVSLLAFSASTLILLGDSTAAAPYASANAPDVPKAVMQLASIVCATAADLTALA